MSMSIFLLATGSLGEVAERRWLFAAFRDGHSLSGAVGGAVDGACEKVEIARDVVVVDVVGGLLGDVCDVARGDLDFVAVFDEDACDGVEVTETVTEGMGSIV